jgi:hypothetical protein
MNVVKYLFSTALYMILPYFNMFSLHGFDPNVNFLRASSFLILVFCCSLEEP